MTRVLRLGLLAGLFVAGVASLLATSEAPSFAYGSLSVTSTFNSESIDFGKIGVCKGESIKIKWEVFEGNNPILSASPAQNVEPALTSAPVANTGEKTVTLKDSLTISLNISDSEDGYQNAIQVVTIPERICTGFPLELRGIYTGTLEQATPQVASLRHTLSIRWQTSDDTLRANLVAGSESSQPSTPSQPATSFQMTCTAIDEEDKLTCIYDPEGAAILTLEGVVTSAGYQGSYQGVIERTTFQVPTTGTFSFVKK
jgi:hypothetical protein